MGDAPEGDDRAQIMQRRDAPAQKPLARSDFKRKRLILGRYATNRIGHGAIDEVQTIVYTPVVSSSGEAERQKRGVEQFAGEISGEGASRSIRTAQTGR